MHGPNSVDNAVPYNASPGSTIERRNPAIVHGQVIRLGPGPEQQNSSCPCANESTSHRAALYLRNFGISVLFISIISISIGAVINSSLQMPKLAGDSFLIITTSLSIVGLTLFSSVNKIKAPVIILSVSSSIAVIIAFITMISDASYLSDIINIKACINLKGDLYSYRPNYGLGPKCFHIGFNHSDLAPGYQDVNPDIICTNDKFCYGYTGTTDIHYVVTKYKSLVSASVSFELFQMLSFLSLSIMTCAILCCCEHNFADPLPMLMNEGMPTGPSVVTTAHVPPEVVPVYGIALAGENNQSMVTNNTPLQTAYELKVQPSYNHNNPV